MNIVDVWIPISHSIAFHKYRVADHLQWETECDETITNKRKEVEYWMVMKQRVMVLRY